MAQASAAAIPAIEIENLTTHYGRVEILHGINMTVNQGEIMIIMGGSGSGKSTLLRYLLGLGTPTSGNIKLLGKDITRISADEMQELRRSMGVAFQGGTAEFHDCRGKRAITVKGTPGSSG